MKGKYNIDDDVWFLNIERLPEQDSETFKPDIEIFIRSILYRSLISSGKIKGIIFRENQVFYELFGTKALRIINEEYVFHSPKYPLKNNIPIFLLEQGVATPCSIRNG